jgi:precorrin-6B methylase 2
MNRYVKYIKKLKIIKYFEKDLDLENNQTIERKEIIDFLKNNSFSIFPYNFIKKYNYKDVIVHTDNDCDMKYVLQDNKRLYFKKSWKDKKIKKYYNSLLMEQDIDSPHRYEYSDFRVQKGDIVVDVGAAEGNFALSIVEEAERIYLFEVDESWSDALKMTFAPWKEKVVVVNKYVSDISDSNCVRLDDFLEGKQINFLKADVEGAELSILKGAKIILSTQKSIKIAICTYHKQNDVEDLNQMLVNYDFHTEFSKGYMIFIYDKTIAPPYLRKGLIRATK